MLRAVAAASREAAGAVRGEDAELLALDTFCDKLPE
jgi:hypothetical protein